MSSQLECSEQGSLRPLSPILQMGKMSLKGRGAEWVSEVVQPQRESVAAGIVGRWQAQATFPLRLPQPHS